MQEPGPPDQTAGVVERVRQTAVTNFQLLVMLEVVREWTRADAVDLAEAAEHTEASTVLPGHLPDTPLGTDADAESRTRAHEQLFQVQRKLDRLAQLAPVQSRDPAVVSAILEGLRRLRVANESAQTRLRTPSALFGGNEFLVPPSRF